MPSKGKAKNAAAHQHDKRHESGLAAPGKRVTKQRSNSHLNAANVNGQANGRPVISPSSTTTTTTNVSSTTSLSSNTSPLQPASGINHAYAFPRVADAARSAITTTADAPGTLARDYVCDAEGKDRDRTNSDASAADVAVGPYGEMADDVHYDNRSLATTPNTDTHFNLRPHQAHAPRPIANGGGGALNVVSTILTYYPLRDAIAILILLLSLPPTLILLIQTLFASLTFVPPTAAITLPNVKEMFNASSLGYPAMATILLVDLIFYLCWLPVWKPVQAILLDLSHAVIAVSLSGAAASTGGPTYSIVTCSTIVCVVHVLRYKAIHLTALDYLRSVLHKFDVGIDLAIPFPASSFLFPPPSQHGWLYTAVRTLLGIHIVSQGVTTCIRRSLASANEKSNNNNNNINTNSFSNNISLGSNSSLSAIAKNDPEAAAGHESSVNPRPSISVHPDPNQHTQSVSSTDGRPPGPPSAGRESKVRESNSKKKRKQANQVRSQQPLWAAIASTKVTFVKEMEQRDAADDAKEASSMDKSSHVTANTTTSTFTSAIKPASDRLWVSEVRDTEVLFSVELSPQTAIENESATIEESRMSAGIDKSKPFYVRVNGASWSSTRILPTTGGGNPAKINRFDGEIFGLAPRSSYLCEIVAIVSQQVLCTASLITQSARTTEQLPAIVPNQPQHQALRPQSPITTLKQSIQQAEARLSETRNKSKKSKKDQRAAYSDIKKEINSLKSKLDNSGGLDDKQARRLQQIGQHKNQAEEATVQLTQQIQALGELPADEVAESDVKKGKWQAAFNAKTSASKEHDGARAEAERVLRDIRGEISATESKREKLAARHQQRKEELDGVVSRQQAEMSARQKHEYERVTKREEQEKAETQLRYHLGTMATEADILNAKALEAYQQAQSMQHWTPQGIPNYSSPSTPEGTLPAANGPLNQPVHTNGYASYGGPPAAFPAANAATAYNSFQQIQNPAPRGRSSSMLSQYSGFTDNADDYAFEPRHQYTWPLQGAASTTGAVIDDRKESEGSSGSSGTNGSTASSSPRPDARPFVPAKMNPIAPPVKKSTAATSPQSRTVAPLATTGGGKGNVGR